MSMSCFWLIFGAYGCCFIAPNDLSGGQFNPHFLQAKVLMFKATELRLVGTALPSIGLGLIGIFHHVAQHQNDIFPLRGTSSCMRSNAMHCMESPTGSQSRPSLLCNIDIDSFLHVFIDIVLVFVDGVGSVVDVVDDVDDGRSGECHSW